MNSHQVRKACDWAILMDEAILGNRNEKPDLNIL
jgi:hypothetical protein